MGRGPSRGRPVGGSALSALRVVRPPDSGWRAYAALGPKAAVLACVRRRRRRLAAVPARSRAASPRRRRGTSSRLGARLLIDTAKGTESSMEPAFAALAALPARRRVVVLGTPIDCPEGPPGEIVARIVEQALRGRRRGVAAQGLRRTGAACHPADPRVRRSETIRTLTDEAWHRAGTTSSS